MSCTSSCLRRNLSCIENVWSSTEKEFRTSVRGTGVSCSIVLPGSWSWNPVIQSTSVRTCFWRGAGQERCAGAGLSMYRRICPCRLSQWTYTPTTTTTEQIGLPQSTSTTSSSSVNWCQAPREINNLHEQGLCFEGHFILNGASCTTRCASGFTPSHSILFCVNGVLMQDQSITCDLKKCASAPIVPHGTTACSTSGALIVGTSCSVSCLPGFLLQGSRTVECVVRGSPQDSSTAGIALEFTNAGVCLPRYCDPVQHVSL